MPYSNNIKKRLREIGRNQEWLADTANMRRDYLNKMINGHFKPNVYDAMTIASILDMTVEDIFFSPQEPEEELNEWQAD